MWCPCALKTLVVQAVLFYLPRHLWKQMENGRMSFCAEGLTGITMTAGERTDRVKR